MSVCMSDFNSIVKNGFQHPLQEELMSWKQLEAYNDFKSGHVRTVFCRVFGRGGMKFVLLKATVNPSQIRRRLESGYWVHDG